MAKAGVRNLQDKLNRMNPAASESGLGNVLEEILEAYNDLAGKYNQLLAKLDTDFTAQNAGVTGSTLDTNYAASLSAADATLLTLEQRGS